MSGSTIMKYAKASQDASLRGTWSVGSGVADSGYLPTNLSGYDVTNPAKLTGTSGTFNVDISAHPTSIIGAALIHTNLTPSLEVRLQGSTTPNFASVDVNNVITIPSLNNNWPVNPYILFGAQSKNYWRINIVGTNPVPVSIGHIVLISATNLIPGAQQGIQWTETIPTWDDVTELDVPMNLDLLTRLKSCQIDTINFDSQQDDLDNWFLDARGINLPFLVIPDVSVNSCHYMTFAEKMKVVTYRYETPYGTTRTMQIKLKEFGRGMLPTPWLI